MFNFTRLVIAMLSCSFSLMANTPSVVKLTPPKLTSGTISEQIYCTRPMREGKFNIALEQIDDKTIVHCYGHGGSGWTTLFGSVNKAIKLFEETRPDKNKPIHIIGSGCMGLTTAIELSRLGYKVSGISTKELYDIPSWRAAGYFALVSVKTSPEEQADLNEIGLNTFIAYQNIDKGSHPYISKDAVKFMPVYCSIDTDAGVEDLEERGMIPPKEYVTLDFGNGVIHENFVKYMTYFMNTTTLMRQLNVEAARLGIPVIQKELHDFSEVPEEVVFNCSGLGGRELNNDNAMIPVRGHLITMNEDSGSAHMEYMIYTKVKQEGKDEYVYLFPKNVSVTPENLAGTECVGVLGGTFIPNVDKLSEQEQLELDAIEYKRMADRCSVFFQGHVFE